MKVGIVGCGFVGSSGAYAMALKGTVTEIVLLDLNKKLAHSNRPDPVGFIARRRMAHLLQGGDRMGNFSRHLVFHSNWQHRQRDPTYIDQPGGEVVK